MNIKENGNEKSILAFLEHIMRKKGLQNLTLRGNNKGKSSMGS